MTTTTTTPADTEEVAILARRPSVWRTAPIDTLILLALLTSANWFLSHSDPGWQRLNPTPWLLLPFFLGGRYGAAAGLVGALLAAAAVLILQSYLGNMTPQALFTTKTFFFLALLIGAAVGTVVYHLVSGPADHLRRRALALAETNLRLSENASLYRANEARLQEALLLHGSETVSLSGELQRLLSGDRGRFEDDLLHLLEREFGVISAAIYRDESGRHASLSRAATTGVESANFPDQIPGTDDAPLASAALASGQLATWRSDWDGGTPQAVDAENAPPVHPHLAAIPWQQSPDSKNSPRALLLIARMDFGQIRWENFACIEAVFAWVMARAEPTALEGTRTAASSPPILPADLFRQRIDEAHRLETQWNLPGRMILFAADPHSPQSGLEEFAGKLRAIVSPGDPLGALGDGQNTPLAIGLVTSVASQEAGEILARQLLSRTGVSEDTVRHHVFSLTEAARLAAGTPQPTAATTAAPQTSPQASSPSEDPRPKTSEESAAVVAATPPDQPQPADTTSLAE